MGKRSEKGSIVKMDAKEADIGYGLPISFRAYHTKTDGAHAVSFPSDLRSLRESDRNLQGKEETWPYLKGTIFKRAEPLYKRRDSALFSCPFAA